MKKFQLVLFIFFPMLAGMIYMVFMQEIAVDLLNLIFGIVIPLAAFAAWFMIGGQYAKAGLNLPVSLLISHSFVLVSAVLYLIMALAALDPLTMPEPLLMLFLMATMTFTCPALVAGSLAQLISPPIYDAAGTPMLEPPAIILQVIFSIILYVGVFLFGFLMRRKFAGKEDPKEESPSPIANR